MIESFREYPALWLLTLVLLVVAIVLFVFASKRKKTRSDSPEEVLSGKDIERLRQAFSSLNEEKLSGVHGKELIYAIITNIEEKLEKGADFDSFTTGQKYVYTLWYFAQCITGRTMCIFFQEYGSPLTDLIVPAMKAAGREDWAKMIQDGYDAYDVKNEQASCDQKTVDAINETFKMNYTRSEFYDACESYIRTVIGDFVDE